MKNSKKENVINLIILLFCKGLIIYDVYMLVLYSLVTGNSWTWTWSKLLDLILAVMTAYVISSDFKKKEKMSASANSKHLKRNV